MSTAKVLSGTLRRVQRSHRKQFDVQPQPAPTRQPARVALMLALAHQVQKAIDSGAVKDRAEVARRLGLTRARVTHLLDLLLLAPLLQESVLFLEAVDGLQPTSERVLRSVALERCWEHQCLVPSSASPTQR
ncbi:MAG: hypothetical protein QM723_18350 [Myxococcaceae bacterium]